jgi:hypothetical protein
MRALALAVVAIAMLAVGSASAGTSATTTSLKVTYWPDGGQGSLAPQIWTLRCNPPGGTLRNPGVACRRLAAGGAKLFAPIPANAVCTEIYGGPFVARVVGTVGGKRVWATFSRTNGCHISRWDRLSPWLLPRIGNA